MRGRIHIQRLFLQIYFGENRVGDYLFDLVNQCGQVFLAHLRITTFLYFINMDVVA